MNNSEPTREILDHTQVVNKKDKEKLISTLTEEQKVQLEEFRNKHSGILEGRFFGALQHDQIETWRKLKEQLNKVGPKYTVPMWKKAYWHMKRKTQDMEKMGKKEPTDTSLPDDSGCPEDEEITVIQEERNEKAEEIHKFDQPRADGSKRYRGGSGENSGKRKRDSLSPVSSISSTYNAKLSSVSPPKIGDMRDKKSFRERSKSPTKSRRSPIYYKRSPYRSRHDRSISPSRKYRKSRSPPKRYGKSRSPSRRHNKSRSPSGKRSYSRLRSKSRSKSREPLRKRYRSKSPAHSSKGVYSSERKTWENFRAEVDALEKERWKNEQIYKKNPEKHPDYKVEWKKFYKNRVVELEHLGKDPKSYNFESEWAYFWKWKMDELMRTDFDAKKDAIRRKLKLPDDETKNIPKPDRLRNAENESYILSIDKNKPGTKKAESPRLIPTLRIVTAVEDVLGSLGPQVNGLLSQCVAVQRMGSSNMESLLQNQDNYVLLETVREKLVGQMQSKIVRKNLLGAVTEAIISIDNLLKSIPSPDPPISQSYVNSLQSQALYNVVPSAEEVTVTDLNVPGIGAVDRVAVAQQIAEALVKQGKTDVTEAELQELVNAVLGMAKTQANQEQSSESGSVLEQGIPSQLGSSLINPLRLSNYGQVAGSEIVGSLSKSACNTISLSKDNSALGLLMSVMQSGVKKSDIRLVSHGYDTDDSDAEFSKEKMALKKFTGFKLASKEFKKNLNQDVAGKLVSDFKGHSAESNKKPLSENYNLSTSGAWDMKGQNTKGKETLCRYPNSQLSPFSSRMESSNPLPCEDDKDLKIIGAWDSDSDIDLDATEKTKAPAYEKVPTKPGFSETVIQNPSPSYKQPNAPQSKEKDASISSQNQKLNINNAIDDLMGSLRKKSSEKQSSSGEQISIISPSSERLPHAKGGSFSSSQQCANVNSSFSSYYAQNIPTQLSQPQNYDNTAASYSNQYYGGQTDQYTMAPYGYPQSTQSQSYYASGGFGQGNATYPSYYNYPPNYATNPGTQAHSTTYQVPYQ